MRSLLVIPMIVMAIPAIAGVLELAPSQDAYICDCEPDQTNPNGGPNVLYQGQYGACFDRILIQWDLSTFGTGTTINDAEMWFYCTGFYGTVSGNMTYHKILEAWSEDTVTYNTQPDFDAPPSATASWPVMETWHTVDITGLVQSWVDGSVANYGVYGWCEDTTGTCDAEFESSNDDYEAYRPKLVVDYTPAVEVIPNSLGETKAVFK